MSKLVLVIDLQKDFINENTIEYVSKIEKLIDSKKYENIVFTKFINSEDSVWYKKLKYTGCMDNEGQEIVIDTKGNKIIEKTVYSALNNELREYIKNNNIKEIYLCGFDTDACVQKTAIDLFENEYEVYVLKDYCMSTGGIELHKGIMNNLKRLIGKKYII